MKTALLLIFALLSVFSLCIAIVIENNKRRREAVAKRIFTTVQIYTIGVFAGVMMIFIPVYYTSYTFGDAYSYIRPILLAAHNTLRVFIVDSDFDIIVQAVRGEANWLRVLFSLYAALLYVVAPVLTFGNVLSLFNNVKDEVRFQRKKNKTHYILSELNEKSIALAKNLKKKIEKEKGVIVFTDVFTNNEEKDYELFMEAKELNAICLRKDVVKLNALAKRGNVEIFLIGEDEAENISQAVKLVEELERQRTKSNVKIFVFSRRNSGSYCIGSIRYEKLLEHNLVYANKNNDDQISEDEYHEVQFKLRRINEQQQLIWNTVPKMKLFDIAQKHENKLSVLIVGGGSYGLEFFKMLVWFFQFEGYKLEINIVDKLHRADGQSLKEQEQSDIESIINKACPELLKASAMQGGEEINYDIEIFSGMDITKSDFADLLLYEGKDDAKKQKQSERLKATNLVMVALGDDELNIESSVYLRRLFDRVNGFAAKEETKWEEEPVEIYSIVYDNQMAEILRRERVDDPVLVNHTNEPFHINFIGAMAEQFTYENIYNADLEKKAYVHHSSWGKVEKNNSENSREDKEAARAKILEETKKYEQFEYFRHSSMAKEIYLQAIRENEILKEQIACRTPEKGEECDCENCQRRKRSEHMRWCAYCRTIGFSYGEAKNNRALIHDKLVTYDKLRSEDKKKD